MSTILKLESGKRYLLRRKSDGLYLGVFGWGLTWEPDPSHLCVTFTRGHRSGGRVDDFHLSLWKRWSSLCQLVEVDQMNKPIKYETTQSK